MALAATIQNAVLTAFSAIDDLAVACSISTVESVTYDPAVSLTATVNEVEQTSIKVLFETYEAGDAPLTDFQSVDRKASTPNSVLIGKVSKGSVITEDATGTTWEVISTNIDPANALLVMQVRPLRSNA